MDYKLMPEYMKRYQVYALKKLNVVPSDFLEEKCLNWINDNLIFTHYFGLLKSVQITESVDIIYEKIQYVFVFENLPDNQIKYFLDERKKRKDYYELIFLFDSRVELNLNKLIKTEDEFSESMLPDYSELLRFLREKTNEYRFRNRKAKS